MTGINLPNKPLRKFSYRYKYFKYSYYYADDNVIIIIVVYRDKDSRKRILRR